MESMNRVHDAAHESMLAKPFQAITSAMEMVYAAVKEAMLGSDPKHEGSKWLVK